jgi:hypothetical protein
MGKHPYQATSTPAINATPATTCRSEFRTMAQLHARLNLNNNLDFDSSWVSLANLPIRNRKPNYQLKSHRLQDPTTQSLPSSPLGVCITFAVL